jgi:dephospho-CoA kinase
MKTVALTGGIGSGKSAVSRYLQSRGVPVYDSDSRTKSLYDSSLPLLRSIEELFGCPLTGPDGKFDRKKLSSLVFGSPEALLALESVVHPAVLEDFNKWTEEVSAAPWCGYGDVPFAVMESAIVLSKGTFEGCFDKAVEVVAPLRVRIRRAMARDRSSRETVLKRVAAQESVRLREPDAVIVNSSTLERLYKAADDVFLNLFVSLQDN